jgi:hypothetical protein
MRDALFIQKQPVSLCIVSDKNGTLHVDGTIPMPIIRLNTTFRLSDKVMTPTFEPPADSDHPKISIDWDVSAACMGKVKMWLMVKTHRGAGDSVYTVAKCYLVATSGSNRMYRIPLANVYDGTGEVCMGNEWRDREHPTLPQALEAAWKQFMDSPYNSDLIKSEGKFASFFRFKPENEGFKTLPCEGQWNNLCERISNPVLETLSLPPASGGDE